MLRFCSISWAAELLKPTRQLWAPFKCATVYRWTENGNRRLLVQDSKRLRTWPLVSLHCEKDTDNSQKKCTTVEKGACVRAAPGRRSPLQCHGLPDWTDVLPARKQTNNKLKAAVQKVNVYVHASLKYDYPKGRMIKIYGCIDAMLIYSYHSCL